MLSSGNDIVDKMQYYNATGNIIPLQWFKTIVKDTGKPYLNAIVILSDIVYWYKPRINRDEQTGSVCSIEKRFKADFLQRSYQQIADQFGITKRDATNAIIALEKLGVVQRHFRTITTTNGKIPNVLFIELNVPRLFFITGYNNFQFGDTYHSNKRDLSPKKVIPITQKSETNTDITTEITTETTGNNIYIPKRPATPKKKKYKDGLQDPSKKHYAEFVALTEDEYNKLIVKLGNENTVKECIDILDNAKGAKGYVYASDYRAILNWVVTEYQKRHQNKSAYYQPQSIVETAKEMIGNIDDIALTSEEEEAEAWARYQKTGGYI